MSFLSILIISCDKYHIFSEVCLYFIKKNILKYGKYNIYYSNQTKQLNDSLVTNILTKDIEAMNFCTRLLISLDKCSSEYIWLIQEDHWYIYPTFSKETNLKIEKICKQLNLDQLKLYPISYGEKIAPTRDDIQTDILYADKDLIISWANGSDYPISHQCTIYKKEYLINNLKESIKANQFDPWSHERFNFKERENIKKKHSDSYPLRIAYINYCKERKTHLNNTLWRDFVKKGKLTESGKNIISENQDIQCFQILNELLSKTDFI